MKYQDRFAKALKKARKARGLTQEDFSSLSSRTYVSTLERGMKSPTLSKINELAEILNIHPLTLLLLAYAPSADPARVDALLRQIERESRTINS
ncbi:MAG: transcriptional regulator [Rhodocyclaceae bacterium]|nr:MAG: transcriptional regulator [Rhodocyclaceae bacterium]